MRFSRFTQGLVKNSVIDPKQVTAVVVTRGDVDLASVKRSLESFHGVLVWDNSTQPDLRVSGRYCLANQALTEYVYVQDDDCIVDVKSLCAEYQPGELLCNVKPHHHQVYSRQYPGITLVGWGAICPRLMVNFVRYFTKYPNDELFMRECDRIFTYLNREKTRVVHLGIEDLPHASGSERMGSEPRHGADLFEIYRRCKSL